MRSIKENCFSSIFCVRTKSIEKELAKDYFCVRASSLYFSDGIDFPFHIKHRVKKEGVDDMQLLLHCTECLN